MRLRGAAPVARTAVSNSIESPLSTKGLCEMSQFAVVICGAGVAGVEGLLRLQRLAGDAVEVTLLSPGSYFSYRPSKVLEPFGSSRSTRYPVARIAADTGACWVQDSLAWVDRDRRVVHTSSREELHYDALLLAVGGRERRPSPHVVVFTDQATDHVYTDILRGLESGAIGSLALVEPPAPSWPLPLYELALLTAARLHTVGQHPEITLITEGPRPLQAFGESAAVAVTALLREAEITLYTDSVARMLGPQSLRLNPGDLDLRPDRIVTLPTITGPNVRGIPGDARNRFIPVDEFCRVYDSDGLIFAAGDATDLPVKQGGVAAQQADTAAAGIAYLAKVAPPPPALKPVMQGLLRTGDTPLYLSADLIGGAGWCIKAHARPPWHSLEAVVASELVRYLPTCLRPVRGA